ncbi:DsbA family protein [Saccharomonospora saliphila]|uniref:DsbA family protein n=1 Tax=Saccharomonospora saliphila TaxID=369829 RepID=UPI00036750CF|nr:thioredoxin domain-containing protein [Saccharomonospora saliphila]
MGGAERAERKRRQEQRAGSGGGGKTVAAARGGTDRKNVIVIVAVVVLVAAVVVGGIVWTNASKNATEGQAIPTVSSVASGVPERRDGAVVITGEPDAPTTIDVYADFLCPVCGDFEEQYGQRIAERVAAGELTVRTHMVPMLTELSDPPGYSLDAANAALLAADEGVFTEYHDSLFAAQPEEGKRGYDDEQLIQLGRDLGITGDAFAEGVRGGTYDDLLKQEMRRVNEDTSLHRDLGGDEPAFGTPLVVADDGEIVDISDPRWLDRVLGGSAES